MIKLYEATAEFWHQGNPIAVGDKVELSDKQAKYLTHVVREVSTTAHPQPEAPAPVEPPALIDPETSEDAPLKVRFKMRGKAPEASDGAGN